MLIFYLILLDLSTKFFLEIVKNGNDNWFVQLLRASCRQCENSSLFLIIFDPVWWTTWELVTSVIHFSISPVVMEITWVIMTSRCWLFRQLFVPTITSDEITKEVFSRHRRYASTCYVTALTSTRAIELVWRHYSHLLFTSTKTSVRWLRNHLRQRLFFVGNVWEH